MWPYWNRYDLVEGVVSVDGSFEFSEALNRPSLILSACHLQIRHELSIPSSAPYLSLCCHTSSPDDNRLTLWNYKTRIKCFLWKVVQVMMSFHSNRTLTKTNTHLWQSLSFFYCMFWWWLTGYCPHGPAHLRHILYNWTIPQHSLQLSCVPFHLFPPLTYMTPVFQKVDPHNLWSSSTCEYTKLWSVVDRPIVLAVRQGLFWLVLLLAFCSWSSSLLCVSNFHNM